MKRIKCKGEATLAERLLQLMKPHGSVQESVSLQEENVDNGSFTDNYQNHRIEIRNALLEAESKKAMGLSARERQRFT